MWLNRGNFKFSPKLISFTSKEFLFRIILFNYPSHFLSWATQWCFMHCHHSEQWFSHFQYLLISLLLLCGMWESLWYVGRFWRNSPNSRLERNSPPSMLVAILYHKPISVFPFFPSCSCYQEFDIFNETLEFEKTLLIFSCCKSALLMSFIWKQNPHHHTKLQHFVMVFWIFQILDGNSCSHQQYP